MANTFGRLPGDGVTNSFGDVMPNVSLELYASEADATAQANSLGSVNTDGYGSWSFDADPTVNTLWVRDPGGGIHPTLPQSVGDAVAANASALAGKADASSVTAIAPDGGKRAVGKGELVLNARDYGLLGNDSTEDLTALNAAISGAGGPVTVYFPRPTGTRYQFDKPFPNVSDVSIVGDGKGTLLRWVAGSMLAATTAQTLSGWSFEDIGIENVAGANHLLTFTNGGGMIRLSMLRAKLQTRATDTSILYVRDSGNLYGWSVVDTELWRMPTQTVPGIDVITTSSGCNLLTFRGGMWHSQNCSSSPFARIEGAAPGGAAYVVSCVFDSIIGEQNLGGILHMYGANGVTVRNFIDYDGGSYTDDLFKFDMSSTGARSYGVDFDGGGTAGVPTYPAGKVSLRITGGGDHRVERVPAANRYAPISLPSYGRMARHGGGPALSTNVATTNITALALDHVILTSGAVTVTLPDPVGTSQGGNIPLGREYIVKNIHASATSTVASAGTATIDGAATKSLSPGQSVRVITDGTNWIAL